MKGNVLVFHSSIANTVCDDCDCDDDDGILHDKQENGHMKKFHSVIPPPEVINLSLSWSAVHLLSRSFASLYHIISFLSSINCCDLSLNL